MRRSSCAVLLLVATRLARGTSTTDNYSDLLFALVILVPFLMLGLVLLRSFLLLSSFSDFVRDSITRHDRTAQKSGAVIISHCGNDCIPCDLVRRSSRVY